MIILINANDMEPLVGPVGLDYVAGAARRAGMEVEVLDLALAEDGENELEGYFGLHTPELVGVTFRNVDDCFWPSGQWFVPKLKELVEKIKRQTEAPVVLGGVGFSIYAERIVEYTGADYGIRGDGEAALVALINELRGKRRFERVDGLIWQDKENVYANRQAWPENLSLPTERNAIDNAAYFARGGQGGLETKRGCDRKCIYCADHLAKGAASRQREPAEVADEVEALLKQGVDVLHLCDAEFNIPREHALAVCEELIRRGLGKRVRWYAYLAVVPFDAELAGAMRQAGCVGINFTGDAGCDAMLKKYRQAHRKGDLAETVRWCRENDIKVMLDLLLGGPGETRQTVAESIDFVKQIGPDCAGAALGIRIYPGTAMAQMVSAEGDLQDNPNLLRHYEGPVDWFEPTFYISRALGERPAALVRDLIGNDERFFKPTEPRDLTASGHTDNDHNYNDNTELVEAIKKGARGAYWDILMSK
jgi:radical SAM superfamily enzyme YgiQ (UPF0313 family)